MRIIQQLVIRLHLNVDALLLRMIIEPSNNEQSFQDPHNKKHITYDSNGNKTQRTSKDNVGNVKTLTLLW